VYVPLRDKIIVEAHEISSEEYKRYGGMDVAIYKNKVIPAGRTSSEGLKEAIKKP
jgi:hypothetical protein